MKSILVIAYLVMGLATFEGRGGLTVVHNGDDAIKGLITVLAWWVSPEFIGKFSDVPKSDE